MMTRDNDADYFPCAGAGAIRVGGVSTTGGVVGVSFGVSWGSHGYAGGVLGEEEVERLVAVLTERLADLALHGPRIRKALADQGSLARRAEGDS